MKLLAVDDARARILAEIAVLPAEAAPLAQAMGRVLAEDVVAGRDQPPFTAAAMDGWAVRSVDCPGTLKVVGESAAGRGFAGAVGSGEAVRIFTGAAVPADCDAVVVQEDAQRDGQIVRVPRVAPETFLRPTGGDFRAGEVLLERGTQLDPWRISLAASAGRAEVCVYGRPRVALLATGEEIVEAPAAPGPWQIYDSAVPGLAAMIAGWGGLALRARPLRDELTSVISALREAEADLVVTVGGASVGDHDLVRSAAQALGLSLRVESVNVRPGRPTFFGTLSDGRRLLGLPGNPASAFVCAEIFLKPIVNAYRGAATPPATLSARLENDLPANGPREHWMRAKLASTDAGLTVRPYPDQDSSLVSVFAASDALMRRLPNASAATAGSVVEVLPLARA